MVLKLQIALVMIMPAPIPRTMCSYQAIRITSTVVMASQIQHLQRIPDTAGPLTGLEQEALGMKPAHLAYIMATIGLVLHAATTPTARGMSGTMVASTPPSASSTPRSSACDLPFQSRLRSSRSNNQNKFPKRVPRRELFRCHQHPFLTGFTN